VDIGLSEAKTAVEHMPLNTSPPQHVTPSASSRQGSSSSAGTPAKKKTRIDLQTEKTNAPLAPSTSTRRVSSTSMMTPEVANPVNKHTQPELSKTRRASWIPNLGLMTDDLDLINRGEWLNDRVVDAINKVVATNLCLDITQTTLLSQAATGFKPNTHESMQIIQGYNHWIATACLGDEVLVADSISQDI